MASTDGSTDGYREEHSEGRSSECSSESQGTSGGQHANPEDTGEAANATNYAGDGALDPFGAPLEADEPAGGASSRGQNSGGASSGSRRAERNGSAPGAMSGAMNGSARAAGGEGRGGEFAPGALEADPPHDLDLEQSVIGAMLVSESAIAEITGVLEAEHFYSERHRILFRALSAMFERGETIERHAVGEELKSLGEYESVGGRSYLLDIYEAVPTTANARRHAEMLRGKALLREMADTGSRINQAALSEPADPWKALSDSQQMLYGVGADRADDSMRCLTEMAPEMLEHIQLLYESDEDASENAALTGFADLDRIMFGLSPGDLGILAARPALGKTAFAISYLMAAARRGDVAFFSMEMALEQIVFRMLSQLASIDSTSLASGDVDNSAWPRLTRAAAELTRLPVWMDDTSGLSPLDIRAKLQRLTRRLAAARGTGEASTEGSGGPAKARPLRLIVVDYFQLMDGVSNPNANRRGRSFENRQQELAAVSRQMKVLARDLGVPVLLLSQLSRAVEARHNKRPILSDLRDTGAAEQDADKVCFLYRDDYYDSDSEEKGVAEVIVGKHRNGPTGTAKLAWVEQFARFRHLPTVEPEHEASHASYEEVEYA